MISVYIIRIGKHAKQTKYTAHFLVIEENTILHKKVDPRLTS